MIRFLSSAMVPISHNFMGLNYKPQNVMSAPNHMRETYGGGPRIVKEDRVHSVIYPVAVWSATGSYLL